MATRKGSNAAARASEVLRAWVKDNPRVPRYWRELAMRLAEYHDEGLWASKIEPLPLLARVHVAWKQAHEEAGRMAEADEAAALSRVDRAIAALREAIELAPFPDHTGQMRMLHDEGMKDEIICVGWRNVPRLHLGSRTLSILEVLSLADELLHSYRSALPARAVQRRRSRPDIAAFVRWLNLGMSRREVTINADVLAHVTNAVFALEPAAMLDAPAIRAILRDTPKILKDAALRR